MRTFHLTINWRHLFGVRDDGAQILSTQMRENFTRHDDQRRSVAINTMPYGANPVFIGINAADTALTPREVRTGYDADGSHICVDLATQVFTMTFFASAERVSGMMVA